MAERRMFAKKITESDAFLDMPLSTQALYFHLCMCAEDKGILNNEILKYRNARLDSYNKAVDDTIKSIKEEYAFTILEEEKIDEIAERLKGAKQNEY